MLSVLNYRMPYLAHGAQGALAFSALASDFLASVEVNIWTDTRS